MKWIGCDGGGRGVCCVWGGQTSSYSIHLCKETPYDKISSLQWGLMVYVGICKCSLPSFLTRREARGPSPCQANDVKMLSGDSRPAWSFVSFFMKLFSGVLRSLVSAEALR